MANVTRYSGGPLFPVNQRRMQEYSLRIPSVTDKLALEEEDEEDHVLVDLAVTYSRNEAESACLSVCITGCEYCICS